MIGSLYKHLWFSFKRSPLLNEKIGQTIFMGFVGLYFLVLFLGLGLLGGELLKDQYPHYDIVDIGTAFIIYAFIYFFFIRMMMQTFPNLHITPYLILPISKGKITNHLLIRSLFSYFNLLPLVLMLPFLLIYIRPSVSGMQFASLLVLVIGFIFLNHFLTFLLSKAAVFNKNWIFLIFPILGGLIWMDYKGYIELVDLLVGMSQKIIANPILGAIPLIICSVVVYFLRSDLMSQYRLSEGDGITSSDARSYHFAWLDRFGVVGALLDLEFRLILRSKRAKSYLYMSGLMLIYPLILGGSDDVFQPIMIAMALFVSGAFSLNYGLLILSWNSLHFDLLLTRVVSYEDIFRAKFYLLAGSTLMMTLIGLPYVFWSLQFYIYVVCISLYCMSIVPAIYMLIANYRSIKVSPNEGGAFSFNGFGATHWLSMIPIMLIPILLFWIGKSTAGEWFGLFLIAGIGMIGLILHHKIITWNTDIFHSRKYALSESFKKQV